MKVKAKDYKILLWLSKLGQTLSKISHELTDIRNDIAKTHGLEKYLDGSETPDFASAEYQEKAKAFSEEIQTKIFDKEYDLAPLGPLTLTEEVITSAQLTPEDMIKLERTGIVTLPA